MAPEKKITAIYEVVEPLVSEADPAALGGAKSEYDNQVQKICKYLHENKGSINGTVLLNIFEESLAELNTMSPEESSKLAEKINAGLYEKRLDR